MLWLAVYNNETDKFTDVKKFVNVCQETVSVCECREVQPSMIGRFGRPLIVFGGLRRCGSR